MGFEIKSLPGGVGVEVLHLDPEQGVSAKDGKALRDVWLEHGIVLFRGMGTSPEVQLELSRHFGGLQVHPIESIRVEGYPELIWLSNKGKKMGPVYYYDEKATIGRIPWHTDLVYTPRIGTGALLRMVEMPDVDGLTGWIDTARAYDDLPEATKQRLEGLEGLFQFITNPGDMRFGRHPNVRQETQGEGAIQNTVFPDFPDVVHSLVLTHPETGRKSLNLSPLHLRHIIGMENEDGDALLHELVAHVTQPKYAYWHDWKPNDMMLWDNRRTMHSTTGNPPECIRLVHRTTIEGPAPCGRLLNAAEGVA